MGSYYGTLKIWNYETHRLIKTLIEHSDRTTSVTVIPDSKYIVSASIDNTIKIWSYLTY